MMKLLFLLGIATVLLLSIPDGSRKVFDVHLHGSEDIVAQLGVLEKAGVYKAALSTSWELQNSYRGRSEINFLYGLMFPCPNGKVPYSLQTCYKNGEDWPSIEWVEAQVKDGKINFLGETLSQYYGISSSDSLLLPYYALAVKYRLPVGIHTGGAGPDHGSPNFKMELGDPAFIKDVLSKFPDLKIWIMHGGDHYFQEAISIMKENKQVYADISVISNPDIVSSERFSNIMHEYIQAGLEDRIMFGTDNGDVQKVIAAVEDIPFLTKEQRDKIFYLNAENFFKVEKSPK